MKKKANPQNKVIVERVIDEELPPGWVKEIRIKKSSNGVRRDPFYNDTATGYVFRSKLDVFRYLETGEISKHAYKRKDGGNIDIHSMQGMASTATVESNKNKGKETLDGSLLPNHGSSNAKETGSDILSVGNNALLDLEADVDVTPIKPQKPEGNENDIVHMDCDPKITKSKQKSNNEETASSRRSSNRLAGVETELVTHTVAIERVLRAANKKSTKSETIQSSEPKQAAHSQQAPQVNNVGSQEDTVSSKNEIVVAEQIKPNDQSGVSTSKRKPERSRKKIVLPRQSSNLLAEIEVKPVTDSVATKRVLRSARSKSAKTEAIPSSGSEKSEQVKDATQSKSAKTEAIPSSGSEKSEQVKDATQSKSAKTEAIPFYASEQSKQVKDTTPIVNASSEQAIVRQYTEPASTPVKDATPTVNVDSEEETIRQYTEPATTPVKNELLVAERIEDNEECRNRRPQSRERKPKRNRKEAVSPIAHTAKRVLRSANNKSDKIEDTPMPSLASEKDNKVDDAPLFINSQEIVPSILPEDQAVKEASRSNITDQTVIGGYTPVEPSRNNVEVERIKRSQSRRSVEVERIREPPSRNNVEVERIKRSQSRNSVEVERIREPPSRNNVEVERIREPPSRNNVEVERIKRSQSGNSVEVERIREPPSRNNVEVERIKPSQFGNSVEVERIKEPPSRNNVEVGRIKEPSPSRNNFEVQRIKGTSKNNSKDRLVTDEVTAVIESTGKEKEKVQQDPQFSFPWSDPCIEFAYKTLTGALPLDDTLAIHDYVQHQIRTSSNTIKSPPLSDCRPSGFSLNNDTVPSNSSTSITFPDPGPPGFSRAPLVDAMPPGFSLNDIPPNCANDVILPDSGPPGFSRGNMPPGFSRSSIPPNSSNNFSPDARTPRFSGSSVPPKSAVNSPGFPWSTVPPNNVNNPPVPDVKPPGFPWDNANHPAAKPAGPPGFPWSSVPSNSGNNLSLPDANPPGFSWSSMPPNTGIGINLNVALPDSAPPGFSQKILPSPKQQQQQHQQQTNPAGIGTQPADFPFQGTMFSWNHRN